MSDINNLVAIAMTIATNQALHKEAQDVLSEHILLELQISEKRGEVIERVHSRQQIEELSHALTAATTEITTLRKALEVARGLIVSHHNMSVKQTLGGFCPVCHHEDGSEPEMDDIANAIAGVKKT